MLRGGERWVRREKALTNSRKMRGFHEFVPVLLPSPVPDRQELFKPQFWIRQQGETKPSRLTGAVPEALNGIPCARALEAFGRGGRVTGSLNALARKGGGKSPESLFRGADGQCSDATLPIRDSLCQLFSWRLVAFARQE